MELKTTTQEMIATFAKMNKISKAKVTDLVSQIVQMEHTTAKRGRKVTEGIQQIQEGVLQMKNFTVQDVSKKFGIDKIIAKRVIRRLEKATRLVRVGKDTNDGKGRKVICWSSF